MKSEPLDALTGEGFRAIQVAFGEAAAWRARIARLKTRIEETKDFRWFSVRFERELSDAQFELSWTERQS